jgi:hypothetical protein
MRADLEAFVKALSELPGRPAEEPFSRQHGKRQTLESPVCYAPVTESVEMYSRNRSFVAEQRVFCHAQKVKRVKKGLEPQGLSRGKKHLATLGSDNWAKSRCSGCSGSGDLDGVIVGVISGDGLELESEVWSEGKDAMLGMWSTWTASNETLLEYALSLARDLAHSWPSWPAAQPSDPPANI